MVFWWFGPYSGNGLKGWCIQCVGAIFIGFYSAFYKYFTKQIKYTIKINQAII